ncbi:carbonic anhydrase [Pseudolabrys sp. FHR47]|uniref:carbonic anhydrase n=1 Tax=Pseudolabrys sp. FHR47 TaxID=2562284 RepID=UPI0010BE37E3|nr:carbonic anhydrase [Pseudolabrys sp. FHR47]
MSFPQRLIEGYSAFAGGRLKSEQDRFRQLAEIGQSPEIMVIGCCDSRVAPEAIFDAGPGELFVARNIANLVPPYTPDGAQRAVSAALEFAVQALRVKHIVVLAHAQCGGIRAYAEEAAPLSPGDFIGRWIELLEPAAKVVGPRGDRGMTEYLTALEQQAAVSTLDNLMTFPCISILVERGKLQLHAAYFGVATGDLSVYDPAQKKFVRIEPADAPFKSPGF